MPSIPDEQVSPQPASTVDASPAAAGAYACGVGLRGLAGGLPDLMVGPAAGWPVVDLSHRIGPPDLASPPVLSEEGARLRLRGEATLLIERGARRAVVVAERPPTRDLLVHPVVALIGGVFSHWAGGTALHAGGVILGGKGWGILGAKNQGKSCTLARLAARGRCVVADDTLVVRAGRAFSGPRAIYLRPDAPDHLGLGATATESARDGERRRLALGPAPASLPLAGWIILRPGSEVAVTRLSAAQRLDVLVRFRNLAFVAPPPQLLDLVALPGFELRHPRRWELLDLVCDRVERLARGGGCATQG